MKANKNWIRWALLGIITLSFVVSYCRIFDPKPDLNGDNFHYFFLAHSLAQGHGYVSEIGPVPEPHMHFPPGYPAFMSLFMHLFPENIVAMKILNGILLLLSLFLLFRIIRKTAGPLGLPIAFVGCLLCSVHPEPLRWATIMMSEMLYLVVSLGIIAICIDLDVDEAFKGNGRHIALLVGLCLLVGFTYFIRTMGISVVLAVALSFFVLSIKYLRKKEGGKRALRRFVVCVLVVASLGIAWESWNIRNHAVSPGYQSEYLNNFKYRRDGAEMKTVSDWTMRIGTNLRAFTAYYIPGSIFTPCDSSDKLMPVQTTAGGWALGVLVIAVMVIGILSFQEIALLLMAYFLITFGVLMLYQEQFAGLRYFVPLIPLMLCALVAGLVRIADWIRRIWSRREQRWLGYAVLVVSLAVFYPLYIKEQEGDINVAKLKHYTDIRGDNPLANYVRASEWIGQNSSDAILIACRKPEVFHYYSGYRHAIPLPNNVPPEEVVEYLRGNGAHGVILDGWFPNAYRTVLPAAQQYPELFKVAQQFGDGTKANITYVLTFNQ